MKIAAWICLLLPLASALALTLGGTRISRRIAGYISTVTTMGSFAAAVVAFAMMWGESASQRGHVTTSWTWLSAGPYHFGLSLLTDQLSIVMMLIVAGVGSLIVAYSVGYMDGEDGQIFAISVMAVAASEVVVGLGLIVAMGRRNIELDVDKLRTLRG